MTPKQRCVQALAQLMGDDLVRARHQAARMDSKQLAAPWGVYDSFTQYVHALESYEADIKRAIAWVNGKED